MRRDAGLLHFVRGLLGGGVATRDGDTFVSSDGRRTDAVAIGKLIANGALAGNHIECRANEQTMSWLKRALLDIDAFAAQHRVTATGPGGVTTNLAESPLARLALGEGAFLQRHHVEAGERVRRLVERAQLQPKVTMTYSASRRAVSQRQGGNDLSDMAADARRSVAEIHRLLPRDCANVVIDVCGLLKGLQQVEREQGWPRRSAKLVLRIGLEQLAQQFGLASAAIGKASRRPRTWMGEGARPDHFD